jgi:hypothetical protein
MASGNCIVFGDDGYVRTVTAGTNAAAAVFTTSSSHGLTTGMSIYFYDFAGGWTGLNANVYTVTVLTSNTFSIPVDSTGFGAFAGSSGGNAHIASTQEQSTFRLRQQHFQRAAALKHQFHSESEELYSKEHQNLL